MRRWFEVLPSPLRAPDDDRGGGSGSDVIRDRVDMGAPQEVGVDHEPEDKTDKVTKKTAEQIELENLRDESARNKRRADDAEEDARYWAARGRRSAADADDTPAPRPAAAIATAAVEMTPEELVEGLNKEGLQALRKAGFISQAELDAKLDELRGEMTGFVKGERADAEFNSRIAYEFPTIAQESAKAAKAAKTGGRYKSEDPLFVRTGEIYREMIADDANLEKSPGTILAAARAATHELQADGKSQRTTDRGTPAGGGNREQSRENGRFVSQREETPARRRDRIERQRPDRGGDDEESRGGGDQFSEEQQAVMKHLNVKPDKFVAHRDAAVRQESRRARR